MKVLTVLAVIIVVVGYPIATIWSLNTLFQLEIQYTIQTWLATTFLQLITFGSIGNKINQNSK